MTKAHMRRVLLEAARRIAEGEAFYFGKYITDYDLTYEMWILLTEDIYQTLHYQITRAAADEHISERHLRTMILLMAAEVLTT